MILTTNEDNYSVDSADQHPIISDEYDSRFFENRTKGTDVESQEVVDKIVELIPFKNHPAYLSEENRSKHLLVETYAWISWNQRVVKTEEYVVAPSLKSLMQGRYRYQS